MNKFPNNSGFTIIEVLVSVFVMSIIYVVATNFVINGLNIEKYVSQQNEAIVQSRKALVQMSGELREMVAADNGAYPIELAGDQEIIFYSDVDNDSNTERVRYFLDNTNLKRGITKPSGDPLTYNTNNEIITIFSEYIQNDNSPVFLYYNANYPQDTVGKPLSYPINKTAVRLIKISVLTNVDPSHLPDTRELHTAIELRNLKENF